MKKLQFASLFVCLIFVLEKLYIFSLNIKITIYSPKPNPNLILNEKIENILYDLSKLKNQQNKNKQAK